MTNLNIGLPLDTMQDLDLAFMDLKPEFDKLSAAISTTIVQTKGGVGKTTLCYHCGYAAAEKAALRVLMIDQDQRCDLTDELINYEDTVSIPNVSTLYHTDKNSEEFAKIVPTRVKEFRNGGFIDLLPGFHDLTPVERTSNIAVFKHLANWLRLHSNNYDAVFIDNPGALGNLTMSSMMASRHFLSPLEMTPRGQKGIKTLAEYISEVMDYNPMMSSLGFIPFDVKVKEKHYKETRALIDEREEACYLLDGYNAQVENRASITQCQGKQVPIWHWEQARNEGARQAGINMLQVIYKVLSKMVEEAQ